MGPHPAVAEVRRAVRLALADVHGPVLVACSGGADSLALAAATAFVCRDQPAGLVTVDHGLQDGSANRAQQVAAFGYELGFDPVHTARVEVGRDGGPEAAARQVRYSALDRVAAGATVLLGHTLDDQAETVLLGLGRGSGPRSIAGMRAVDGRYRRPLLGVRRATTRAACLALGLAPWDDPHNADPSFRRVRLRHEVLPLLEEVLAGGVAEALARTALLLQQDLDALDQLCAGSDGRSERRDELPVAELAGKPTAVRSRVLRDWLAAVCPHALSGVHLAALDALVVSWHGQGPIDLPGGYRVERASGTLKLRPPGIEQTGVTGVRARR
jgi:tRNA(Ile)-lysidine synthase